MAREYLKKAQMTAQTDAGSTQEIVAGILSDIQNLSRQILVCQQQNRLAHMDRLPIYVLD